MVDMTMRFEPVAACGKPEGDVAYLRMPLALSAMDAMNRFVEKAYGKDCVCTEEPKGWLKVSTPNSVLVGRDPANTSDKGGAQ